MTIKIREEKTDDYRLVEEITRDAFWNLYVPGCGEHYIAHIIRSHEDFIPQLDLVIELDGQVIGNIMYTKSKLTDENGNAKTILTFGPVCIAPEYQREGYGKRLMERSFEIARELGYDAIVIFGMAANYVARGFVSCKRHNVKIANGTSPTAMLLVKELTDGALDGHNWIYRESPAFEVDKTQIDKFDANFKPKEKRWQPSQEEFYIVSHSNIN